MGHTDGCNCAHQEEGEVKTLADFDTAPVQEELPLDAPDPEPEVIEQPGDEQSEQQVAPKSPEAELVLTLNPETARILGDAFSLISQGRTVKVVVG